MNYVNMYLPYNYVAYIQGYNMFFENADIKYKRKF